MGACAGGQSGTETPVPTDEPPIPGQDAEVTTTFAAAPCPCALAGRSALLHVQLLELGDCRVRARVEAVLNAAPGLTLAIDPGAELDVPRETAGGCDLSGVELTDGAEALLVYEPPREGEPPDGGRALVASWGPVHAFGTGLALPAARRDQLLDLQACSSWFAQHPRNAAAAALPPGDPSGGAACNGAIEAP